MKTLWRVLIVALLAGGWALSAAALHVIYTGNRVVLLPKHRLSYTDTYVDPRAWKVEDLPVHSQVVQRMIESGKVDLLTNLADGESDKPLEQQIREALQRVPDVEKQDNAPSTQPLIEL